MNLLHNSKMGGASGRPFLNFYCTRLKIAIACPTIMQVKRATDAKLLLFDAKQQPS
jgi:hypothetical protein